MILVCSKTNSIKLLNIDEAENVGTRRFWDWDQDQDNGLVWVGTAEDEHIWIQTIREPLGGDNSIYFR